LRRRASNSYSSFYESVLHRFEDDEKEWQMSGADGVMERLGAPLARDAGVADLRPTVRIFPGEERQLHVMRRWLEELFPEHPALSDMVCIATELGTNAIRHTASGRPGGSFAVVITSGLGVVTVSVADRGGPWEPLVINDPDGESGRGLLIVRGLAAQVGVRGDYLGRVVWAEVRSEPAVGAELAVTRSEPALDEADTKEVPIRGAGELALRQLQNDGII
jgi:serine/threonine-protein kinase RsbW